MPKIVKPLTVGIIKAALNGVLNAPDAKSIELRDGAVPLLELRVSKTKAVWSLKTNPRTTLGAYPRVGLPEARKKALEAKERTGEQRATLSSLIEMYALAEGVHLRTWREQEARMRGVFAPVLEIPLRNIDTVKLQLAVDAYPSKSSAAAAVRYVKPVLKWGMKRGASPFAGGDLEQPKVGKPRQRVLSRDELRAILTSLGDGGNDVAVWLMLLTCARREEVCGATPGEIQGDVWRIPPDRSKNGNEVLIPITEQMRGHFAKLPLVTGNWDRWQKRFFRRSGTSGWHRHDLRRASATVLGELGVAPHIIEVCLGHAHPHSQLSSVYNKSRYMTEHREALEMLGRVYADMVSEVYLKSNLCG